MFFFTKINEQKNLIFWHKGFKNDTNKTVCECDQ